MQYVTLLDPDMVTVVRGLLQLGFCTPSDVSRILGISEGYAKSLINAANEQFIVSIYWHVSMMQAKQGGISEVSH